MSKVITCGQPRSKLRRLLKNRLFVVVCIFSAASAVVVLVALLVSIVTRGAGHLDLAFVTSPPSRKPGEAGIHPAMWGTIWVCFTCALLAIPMGVGTAILLEEFKPTRVWAMRLHGFVQLNIANLAGVPSIVYGILGLTAFVQMFGAGGAGAAAFEIGVEWHDQFADAAGNYLGVPATQDAPPLLLADGLIARAEDGGRRVTLKLVPEAELDGMMNRRETLDGVVTADTFVQRNRVERWYYMRLPLGRGVLTGGLTLMLVVLPIMIISAQESLRAVPASLRHGALALGATRWQVVRGITLPAAVPGIMTGAILAMSRAIGEAAPILVIAGIVYITFTPQNLMDDFTAMPLQIFDWASRPQSEFHDVAAAGIVVLLAILLTFNAVAVYIRQKFQRPL
jgi:phosphate transport system permease protein